VSCKKEILFLNSFSCLHQKKNKKEKKNIKSNVVLSEKLNYAKKKKKKYNSEMCIIAQFIELRKTAKKFMEISLLSHIIRLSLSLLY
jgi:hypothetical protein